MATLTAIFNARDRVSETMKKMSDSTKEVTEKFAKLAKIATGALIGIGLAATGVATKALSDFSTFDRGMREVWTLLPDLSEDAFGKMQKDVLQFSKDMKVLPEDTIPAVYQALSLGVPKGGLFDFLETANKLAVGGVTGLGKSVTALRSIVKGMGLDIEDSGKVSDILFTTMKKGATTITELADQFPKVTTFASGLGITVEELGATFATLTGVTGNTAEVSTQMRGLFTEMSKSGTTLSKTFSGLTGKSFKQFVKGGGNMIDALTLVRKNTDAAGIDFIDLFGSVEAGTAALALTGNQFETYTDNLKSMNKANGATEDAFSKMDSGISNLFQDLKVRSKVAFIELGEKLAPTIAELGEKFLDNIPKLEEFFTLFLERVPQIAESVVSGFGEIFTAISGVINFISENQELITNLGIAFGTLVAVGWAFTAVMAIVNGLMAAFAFITSPIGLIILAIAAAIYLLFLGFKTGFFDRIVKSLQSLPDKFESMFASIKSFAIDSAKGLANVFLPAINKVIDAMNLIPGVDIKPIEMFETDTKNAFGGNLGEQMIGISDSPMVAMQDISGAGIDFSRTSLQQETRNLNPFQIEDFIKDIKPIETFETEGRNAFVGSLGTTETDTLTRESTGELLGSAAGGSVTGDTITDSSVNVTIENMGTITAQNKEQALADFDAMLKQVTSDSMIEQGNTPFDF